MAMRYREFQPACTILTGSDFEMTDPSFNPALPLAVAIRQLRVATGEADMTDAMSQQSAHAFAMHDAVHVVFECDDSLQGEISAHVWMALGTTAPLSDMHRAIASREHRSVLSGVGHLRLLGTWLGMVPRIVRIIWRARRMTARLPYADLSTLMDEPVASIRARYGIRLAA
jgi:hypothetical protein